MPQLFQVLSCYKCEMFQVHQVKKSNKWQCRVCNEKQSLKKAFKIGPSRNCRFLVQELNMRKGGNFQETDQNTESYEDSTLFSEEIETPGLNGYTDQVFSDLHLGNGEIAHEGLDDEHNSSLDFHFEVCDKNPAVNNVIEASKFEKNSLYKPNNTNVLSRIPESIKQCKPGVHERNFRKRQGDVLETVSISTLNVTPPPLKKNRGFQMILNAASKLN